MTLRVRGRVGYADSYGDTDTLPFFENFYGGGFGSIRGFERNSLGPRSSVQEIIVPTYATWDDNEVSDPVAVLCQKLTDCTDGKLITNKVAKDYGRRRGAFGGNLIIEGGAEILFPLPFIKDQRSLQTSLFLDAGNVFETNCGAQQRNCYNVSLDQVKTSVGLGLTWISSFGPMQFSLSKPHFKESQTF